MTEKIRPKTNPDTASGAPIGQNQGIRLYQVAPISTNLILSHLAEHVLGLPRSY